MKRWERWALHLLTVGISGSGLVYFWMKYLLTAEDPFSLVNHRWQPAMLEIHLLLSPSLIFLMGMILRSHIARKLRNKTRNSRRTGLLSLFTFPVMVLSGYGLQLLVDPAWTQAVLAAHLVSGTLFALSYAVHLGVKLREQPSSAGGAVRLLKVGFVLALAMACNGALSGQAGIGPTLGLGSAKKQKPITGVLVGPCLETRTSQAPGSPPPELAAAGRCFQAEMIRSGAMLGAEEGILLERQVFLMGTRCQLAARAPDRASGRAVLQRLLSVLEQTEAQLSTWRPDSSLSLLNQSPLGSPFPLSPSICRLFGDLYQWQERTGGAFDPTVGNLIQAWGLRTGGRIPSPADLAKALQKSGLQHLHFDSASCSAQRRRAVILDAGAFGKGEALDRALDASNKEEMGPWMINLGGQVMVYGSPSSASGWTVDVAHPLNRQQAAMQIVLRQGSLAVSGGSERDLNVNGRRIGHILDPRSGRPAAYSGSVAVWHPSGLAADLLSTALYVMGEEEGIRWAQQNDLAACFLTPSQQGKSRQNCSPAFHRRFR